MTTRTRLKLSAAQKRAVTTLRAWGKPFRAFPPRWSMSGFLSIGHGPETVRWATYEKLVSLGVVTETGYFPCDATEGPSTCFGRAGNGRHAILTELLNEEPAP